MSWFSNFGIGLVDAAENALNCVKDLPEIILKQVVIVIALLWYSGVDHYFTYSKKDLVARYKVHISMGMWGVTWRLS